MNLLETSTSIQEELLTEISTKIPKTISFTIMLTKFMELHATFLMFSMYLS